MVATKNLAIVVTSLALVWGLCSGQPSQPYQPYCDTKYYYQKIDRTGCDSTYAGTYVCIGTCQSYVIPYESAPFFRKTCSCCKPANPKWKWIKLGNCASGVNPYAWIQTAGDNGCDCLPC